MNKLQEGDTLLNVSEADFNEVVRVANKLGIGLCDAIQFVGEKPTEDWPHIVYDREEIAFMSIDLKKVTIPINPLTTAQFLAKMRSEENPLIIEPARTTAPNFVIEGSTEWCKLTLPQLTIDQAMKVINFVKGGLNG